MRQPHDMSDTEQDDMKDLDNHFSPFPKLILRDVPSHDELSMELRQLRRAQ